MTPSQLRQWSFQNSQPDQWWLCLDAVTEEIPVTVAEIEERLKSGDYSTVQALHVSQGDMENPPWVEVTMPPAMKAPPAIRPPVAAADEQPKTSATAAKPVSPEQKGNGSKDVTVKQFFTILGAIVLGIWLFPTMCGDNREAAERKARQAEADELRWERERQANIEWNREHGQSQGTVRAARSASNEWYAGGTLSSGSATMAEWNRATYENRLASSADFVARSMGGNLGSLDMDDDIKPMAERLEIEISAAYEPGVTDNLAVHVIAAGCITILKQHGQWID